MCVIYTEGKAMNVKLTSNGKPVRYVKKQVTEGPKAGKWVVVDTMKGDSVCTNPTKESQASDTANYWNKREAVG
jgi:hypothetical protein